jgi:putative nucleotidyltransferase with HDIG domain
MSSSLALRRAGAARGHVALKRPSRRAEVVADDDRSAAAPVRLRRYLPLAVLTTGSVIVLPAGLVSVIIPPGGVVSMVVSAAAAVATSIAIASAEAAAWKRRPRSRDIVFGDLMLWGWLRRCWTERRLTQARALYDSARKSGPTVSIELLTGLSRLLEARDAYTHGHSQRVARHAERIGHAMRLSPVEVAKIRTAASVHDVGKLYTPREILNNPGRLTDAEFAVMKRHAADGADMLAEVGDPEIEAMVRHHHERMDGRGYPDGLLGVDIPLGARIIAVADTFDAITSWRPYRAVRTQKKALDVLSKEAGSQLDGAAVAAFLHRYSARRSVAWFALVAAAPQRMLAVLQTSSPGLGAGLGGGASIVPALGAAGLLALSPGLHRNTLLDGGKLLQPALTGSRLTIPSTPATGTTRHASRQTTNTGASSPNHHQSRRIVHPAPGARAPVRSTASAPTSPGGSGHEPAPSAPTAPPGTGSPVRTPTTPLPVGETPEVHPPPAGPPVTIPSVPPPAVSVPTVTPPTVTVPGVTVPGAGAPTVKIPNLG